MANKCDSSPCKVCGRPVINKWQLCLEHRKKKVGKCNMCFKEIPYVHNKRRCDDCKIQGRTRMNWL